MIRCGHCHGRHATVPEVKACSVAPVRPPVGRYAIHLRDGSGALKLRFFIVTEKRVVEQGGPNRYPVPATAISRITREIMVAPLEALLRYGKELMICGSCGLPLTKEISRTRGMGEICWERHH